MKVKDLIRMLERADPELPVCFAYDYGDYWHSVVAPEIEDITEGKIMYSAYHQTTKMLSPESEGYENHGKNAILLTGV